MSADYTGLHGRSPYEGPHQAWRGPEEEHAVPEGWEDLNRGICPWCGRTVAWDADTERWVRDETLTVLVLTADEVRTIYSELEDRAVVDVIDLQERLNRPYVEAMS